MREIGHQRTETAPWLPLWGSWLPRKGQSERVFADCGTLSVSLTAASSPKGRAKGGAKNSAFLKEGCDVNLRAEKGPRGASL